MAVLRRLLITGIVLSACGAVYALYECRAPIRDVAAYWTPSRLAYIDADRELESVLNLTTWIAGGTGITVADDGDGTITLSGHAALTVVDSQSINLTLSTQQLTADVNDKDYGDVVVSGTGSSWAVDNDSHDHTAVGSTVTINAADIIDLNAGTAITADLEEETHTSEHAVSGSDTVFPADPGADRYLMWDDVPGELVWAAIAGVGDMTKAVYDVLRDGFVDGNDTAYGAAWNGNINAPSMNAVYDQINNKSRSFVIKGITSSDDFVFWESPRAITITKVAAICTGGTNVIGQLQEYTATAGGATDVNTGDWTVTTTEFESTSFTNATLDAGDWLGFKTTSVSGTVSFFSLTFEYYEQ